MVNHGVPQALIDDTFAEARRFHAQPMEAKLALRMNEHNNGYMMLGRYAVWTSDVNANDKPDLNEAFFVKRERGPDDPLVRAGRRFAGPNRWPADLPGFREAVLAYTDAVDALGRRLLPLCAMALDLPPDTFDGAFAESQFSFRLTHYPPVAAESNQFGIAPHTDANFMTFLAQSDVPGLQVRMPGRELGGRAVRPRLLRGEFGRHDAALDERTASSRRRTAPCPPWAVRATPSPTSWGRIWTPRSRACRPARGRAIRRAIRPSPTRTTSTGGTTPTTTPRASATWPERSSGGGGRPSLRRLYTGGDLR